MKIEQREGCVPAQSDRRQINATSSKIKEGNEFREEREADLAKAGNSRDAYVTTVMELSAKLDEIGKHMRSSRRTRT